jgi:hypothetical protein
VITEHITTLRANRDLDGIKTARAITQLASKELRLRGLRWCGPPQRRANSTLARSSRR